jgi:hypothetical protein
MGDRPVTATASSRPTQTTLPGQSGLAAWLSGRPEIEVVALRHPFFEALGHHPMSDYAELFWLPVVGPSALWAHRRLASGFLGDRASYRLNVAALASEIGLGGGTGASAPIIRTLVRLVRFDLAAVTDRGSLGVRPVLPPLTRRQAARLPEHLAARHHRHAGLDRRSPAATHALDPEARSVTRLGVESGR